MTWDEIEHCEKPADLVFEVSDVIARLDDIGDPFSELDACRQRVPGA